MVDLAGVEPASRTLFLITVYAVVTTVTEYLFSVNSLFTIFMLVMPVHYPPAGPANYGGDENPKEFSHSVIYTSIQSMHVTMANHSLDVVFPYHRQRCHSIR